MIKSLSALACALVIVILGATPVLPADQTVGERIDDAKITTMIKAKLTKESVKNLVKVEVTTREGVVHLQGTVPTADDKAQAERIARDTSGVRDVTNDLRVSATGSSPSASPRQ
jgi:hyperosmotically inducible periplasmic protein